MVNDNWVNVESGVIAALRFQDAPVVVERHEKFSSRGRKTRTIKLGTLYVRFQKGSVYRYDRVHRDVYEALVIAKSVGSAYNDLIPHGSGVLLPTDRRT